MIKTAVVILNWNGKNLLEKFLPSVISFSSADAKIFVIDNASTDDSVSFLEQHFPSVGIVQNASNGGFSKGYNDGLKQIDAEYFVLLNSDVEVTENWITPIIKLMDDDKSIAACQPKIKSYQQKKYFEYAGAAGGYLDKYYYPFCRGRIFDTIEEDKGQYDDTREIFWASGASLFVRAKLYFETGGLDEDFFAHMEEIDLCWRLKNKAHKIMYCAGSTVYHMGGGTLSKVNPTKTFLNFRNNLFIITKNVSQNKLYPAIFMRMILDGIASMKFLFSGSYLHAWAVFKAHMDFYRNFKKMKLKRNNSANEKLNLNQVLSYPKSIVAEYYLQGRKRFSEISK